MTESDLGRLYAAHLKERQEKTEAALGASGFDALVIHSGTPLRYHADDQEAPFRATPHFAHWLPLEEANDLLIVRPREKPMLVRYVPDDFWREYASLDPSFWSSAFEIAEAKSVESLFNHIAVAHSEGKTAYIGDNPEEAKAHGVSAERVNPPELLALLDRDRSLKTGYEVACIAEANRIAAPGFAAAKVAFLEEKDELGIHHAYLSAVGATERELPYETIVALNEKGAILHYQGKRRGVQGKSLLLDAGARYLGYCSDITRIWAADDADPLFKELIAGVEKLQQELCAEAKPGLPFSEFQKNTHVKIGNLLNALGVLKVDGKKGAELKLTNAFFPHGVGHFLGIQVHDVGSERTKEGDTLRNTTVITEGQVFTIEPGVYFNELLLKPHRSGDKSAYFDWNLIDRLAPYGGVRIEDDVYVNKNGVRNLTKESSYDF